MSLTMSLTGNDNLLLKLRERKDGLTPVEIRIASYVLENPEEVPRLSIRQLASASRTSDASVLRFCRTLGFQGYRDFIVSLSSCLGSKEEDSGQYTDIQPGDDLDSIITTVARSNCRSIEDTMRVVDREEIARAVELLRQTDRVDFFGMGASGLVCMDACQKFMRINKMCHAYTDGHSQLTAASLMTRENVVVMISNSGKTAEIVDALGPAKKNGAKIIAITRFRKSPLADQADVALSISTPEISIRSGAMGSRIAMLSLVDILFIGVASADYDKVRQYLSKTHNILVTKKVN